MASALVNLRVWSQVPHSDSIAHFLAAYCGHHFAEANLSSGRINVIYPHTAHIDHIG